jgi:hypothetical protein
MTGLIPIWSAAGKYRWARGSTRPPSGEEFRFFLSTSFGLARVSLSLLVSSELNVAMALGSTAFTPTAE